MKANRSFASWRLHRLMLLYLASISINILYLNIVSSTRIRLNLEGEPTSAQCYNNYRTTLSPDPHIFYLRSANVSFDEIKLPEELQDDTRDSTGKFPVYHFKFNSSERLRKSNTILWFVPLDERTGLQLYDDPREKDLARGPQVDQKLCGLHLDYMIHMMNKHLTNIANSTEYSMYNIMLAFDAPKTGLAHGNNLYPGDYSLCLENKLNIIKSELDEVDSEQAASYFESRGADDSLNFFAESLDILHNYLGPMIGLSRKRKMIPPLETYKDKLRLLPMRYCLTNIRYPVWPNTTFHKRNFVLRLATCLPETCDSDSYKMHGDKLRKLVDFQMTKYHSGYYINDVYCLPDEKSPLRNPFAYPGTTLLIVFNVIWISLILSATVIHWRRDSAKSRRQVDYSHHKEKSNGSQVKLKWWHYLECWSLRENLRSFLTPKQVVEDTEKRGKNYTNLDPLEGLKFLSTLSVITSHICVMMLGLNPKPEFGHKIVHSSWVAIVNSLCPPVVDNFFVITAMMTAKSLFQFPKKQLKSTKFWLQYFAYRYLRLVPLYLMFEWFLKSGFRFLGAGPYWDYGTSRTAHSSICQNESYWTVLLPSANFKSPGNDCNGVNWYLANDMQFAILTPIITLLYLKGPILGHLSVFVTVIAVMTNHVNYYLKNLADSRGVFDWSMMMLTQVTDDTTGGYVYPQYRCVAHLIGMAAGYVLCRYEKGRIKGWPKPFIVYGKYAWYVFLYTLVFTPFITGDMDLKDSDTLNLVAALFCGLIHGIASVMSAIFILLLCTGYFPLLGELFSQNWLRLLSKASLSTVLVHLPLVFYHLQSSEILLQLTVYNFAAMSLVWCVEAFALSVVVHLVYELPLRKFLFKLIFRFPAEKVIEKKKIN